MKDRWGNMLNDEARTGETAKNEEIVQHSYRLSKCMDTKDDRPYEEEQNKASRTTKERDKNSSNIYQSKVIKVEEDRALVEDDNVLETWKELFHKLNTEKN